MTKEKEYMEFVEAVRLEVAKLLKLPLECVRFQKGTKEDKRDRILIETIYENGLRGVMRVEAAGLFLLYKRGTSIKKLAEEIKKDREEKCDEKTLEILQLMEDYEKLKERLIVRAIRYESNSAQIENSVHIKQGDIALVVYLIIRETEFDFLSAKVQKETVKKWNLSEKEIFNEAMVNTHVLYPPRIYDFLKGNGKFDYQEGAFMNLLETVSLEKGIRGNCLTNVKQLNGATVLFYPGVAERIATLLEDDFYVAFTSIHEAMIHSACSARLAIIQESLQSVNEINDEAEILSYNVYYYSRREKKLVPVELP